MLENRLSPTHPPRVRKATKLPTGSPPSPQQAEAWETFSRVAANTWPLLLSPAGRFRPFSIFQSFTPKKKKEKKKGGKRRPAPHRKVRDQTPSPPPRVDRWKDEKKTLITSLIRAVVPGARLRRDPKNSSTKMCPSEANKSSSQKGLVSTDRSKMTALLSTTPRLKPRSSTNDFAPLHSMGCISFWHPD